MNMLKNKLVYLHTGCKWSEPWDEAFRFGLNKLGCEYIECDLATVVVDRPGVFIGRLNESCLQYKEIYEDKSRQFEWCWPEPLAMWLYDDKIRQVNWLKHQSISVPKQMVVNRPEDVSMLPCVQKLANGSASRNVKRVHLIDDVEYPSVHQEFCDGNDSDYRITIIGDYAMGSRRMNRPGDFRASGSNNCIILDKLPEEPVKLSAQLCRENAFTTMAFDWIKKNNEWVMIEMSYAYPIYSITRDCKFYFNTRTMERYDATPDPVAMLLRHVFQVPLS